MRTIVIGDTHTKDIWKQIVDWHRDVDKIIFLGDYVDPYHRATEYDVIQSLRDIIQFKRDNIDKVVLLIGNHDAHYIWDDEIEPCSRYNRQISATLNKIYTDNLDLFTLAHQIGDNLFTHAGVSTDWLVPNLNHFEGLKEDYSNLADILNKANETEEGRKLIHRVGNIRGGDYPVGGPTWADISETRDTYLPHINQYVGHSKVGWIAKNTVLASGSITYCDTLHKVGFSLIYDVAQLDI